MAYEAGAPEAAPQAPQGVVVEGAEDGGHPEWITLVYRQRHTCSGRSGVKEFNVFINERTMEQKPAWELLPVLDTQYGSRCSGAVEKHTSIEKVLEKANEGWTIVKNVLYKWHAGRRMVEVTYYHIPSRTTLEHERDHDVDYHDKVVLPAGKLMKVYKERVEVV
ncbi:hypothetical protein [Aeropyrum globular virus 1]|uniref:hypothetical protein n=1 Tax=Aeropyrum globular virus 1 TaxID=1932713 RepID=UPI000C7EB89E|nr:hypothetical protein C1186_gp14 [Aeropyrum globular virus 1]BBC20940.1 hypothetical protein [Aeropyrum globular virus 1]